MREIRDTVAQRSEYSGWVILAIALLSYVPIALRFFGLLKGEAWSAAVLAVSLTVSLISTFVYGLKNGFNPLFAVVSFVVISVEVFLCLLVEGSLNSYAFISMARHWSATNAGAALAGNIIGFVFYLKRKKRT